MHSKNIFIRFVCVATFINVTSSFNNVQTNILIFCINSLEIFGGKFSGKAIDNDNGVTFPLQINENPLFFDVKTADPAGFEDENDKSLCTLYA